MHHVTRAYAERECDALKEKRSPVPFGETCSVVWCWCEPQGGGEKNANDGSALPMHLHRRGMHLSIEDGRSVMGCIFDARETWVRSGEHHSVFEEVKQWGGGALHDKLFY